MILVLVFAEEVNDSLLGVFRFLKFVNEEVCENSLPNARIANDV